MEIEVNRLVFGCGYLGLRVAKQWLQAGDRVSAVTRSAARVAELEALGIQPIIADITNTDSLTELPTADTVLFSVGYDRARYPNVRDVYVDGFNNVLENLPKETGQLIYISTTGVYGGADGEWVSELSTVKPTRPSSQACLDAEALLQQSDYWSRSVVLRLAGIYGPSRIPRMATIQNRKWSELDPAGYINLIHVDDAAAAVCEIARQKISAETFLVSDGNPPQRSDFYEYIAGRLGVGPILWPGSLETGSLQRSGASKRISNRGLLERTGINLAYPNFRLGIDQALRR